MNIHSVFYPAGKIASPIHYETIALQVDLESYINATTQVEAQLLHLQQAYPQRNVSDALAPQLLRLQEATRQAATALSYFSAPHRVEKRQVSAILAAGLGALIAVGSAIFGHSEVEQMGEKLKSEHRHNKHLDHRLSELTEMMQQKLGTIADRFAADEALVKAGAIIEQICAEVEAAVESYYSLASHKIHPGLIPPTQLREISKQVQASAKQQGAVPVVQLSEALMHLPLSWILRKKGIQLFLHVPMVPEGKDHVRQLLWLHSATKTVGHEVKSLTGSEKFISLGHHKGTYVVHTAGELELCHQMMNLRLCPHPALHHMKHRHCIAGLYNRNSKVIHDHCKEETSNRDLPLLDYATKQFYVRRAEKARIYCGDEETRPLSRLQAGQLIQLEDGCEMQGESFHLYMPHINHVNAEVQEVIRKVPVLKVSDDTEKAIDSILKTMGLLPTTEAEMEDKAEEEEVESSRLSGFDAALIGIAVGSALTAGIAIFCICRHRRSIGRLLRSGSRAPKASKAEDEDDDEEPTRHSGKTTDNPIFSPPELGKDGSNKASVEALLHADQQPQQPLQPSQQQQRRQRQPGSQQELQPPVHPVMEARRAQG